MCNVIGVYHWIFPNGRCGEHKSEDVERKTEEDVVMRTWKMEVSGHRKRKTARCN